MGVLAANTGRFRKNEHCGHEIGSGTGAICRKTLRMGAAAIAAIKAVHSTECKVQRKGQSSSLMVIPQK
jgi:hypothetical protein